MKNRVKKLIENGLITESEIDTFVTTLVKLSALKLIPSKPKKVIKRLGIKKDKAIEN